MFTKFFDISVRCLIFNICFVSCINASSADQSAQLLRALSTRVNNLQASYEQALEAFNRDLAIALKSTQRELECLIGDSLLIPGSNPESYAPTIRERQRALRKRQGELEAMQELLKRKEEELYNGIDIIINDLTLDNLIFDMHQPSTQVLRETVSEQDRAKLRALEVQKNSVVDLFGTFFFARERLK